VSSIRAKGHVDRLHPAVLSTIASLNKRKRVALHKRRLKKRKLKARAATAAR